MAARVPAQAARMKENQIDQEMVGVESPIRVGYPSGPDLII
jgi:hypothetical protein